MGALALVAAAAVAPAAAAPPATKSPTTLVVAVSLPRPGLQVGAVRGSDVVVARGLEVDVARALARRLGVRAVRFVHVPRRERLLTPGAVPWDVAMASLAATPARERAVSFSRPYLTSDQAVLLRRGLGRPRSLAALRPLQLCAERGSRGADAVVSRVRPRARPLLAARVADLVQLVQTGRCDAAVADAVELALAARGRGDAVGTLAARLETGAGYAVVAERGSPLVADVDRALRRLAADGTLHRLARAWLGVDPARLPALR